MDYFYFMNKVILVFVNNELIRQINYKTKTIAKKQFSFFKKHGILDYETGEKINGATFELL